MTEKKITDMHRDYYFIFSIVGFFAVLYPFIFIKYLDYQSIINTNIPYKNISWNYMFIWLIYIVPILNVLLTFSRLIDGSFKDFYMEEIHGSKELKEMNIIWKLILIIYAIFSFLMSMYLGNTDNYSKKFKYIFSKVIYVTFVISIYVLRERFLKNCSFDSEVLSGDVVFGILPFILSLFLILHNPFKKYE
jgi:hypothetical protein